MGNLPVQSKMITLKEDGRALIIKPSSLGDIVHALPFLGALKKRYPDIKVDWVVFKGLHGIIEGHPLIDNLIVIDKSEMKSPSKIMSTAMGLRKQFKLAGYDIAIDLQGLLRSGVMAMLSSAPVRVGFSEAREGATMFYTLKVQGVSPDNRDIHAVDRYMKIAAALGCDISPVEFPMVHDECAAPFDGDYAVLVPGARWESKKWPAKCFGELAQKLPIKSVIVGGPEDCELAQIIVDNSNNMAFDMTGRTTLKQLSGLIKNAKYMVTNDTGPMHIGAAYNVPVFAIFGPTNYLRTGPYGQGHTIIDAALSCAPCYNRSCDDLRCMNEVTADMVLTTINDNVL